MPYSASDITMRKCSHFRKEIPTSLLLFAAIALPWTAYGDVVTVFDTEASFQQTGLVVSTETFDEFPVGSVRGTETARLDGIIYTSDQPGNRWIAGIHTHQVPPQYISPPNDFGTTQIGTDTLTFGDGEFTDAIGFYILTAGLETSYNITVTTTDGQTFLEPLVFDPNPSFRGFIAPEGISSVAVTNAFPQSEINYSFDNVSRGQIVAAPVPEPCTFLLLAGGLAGMFILRRKARNKTAHTFFQRTTVLRS